MSKSMIHPLRTRFALPRTHTGLWCAILAVFLLVIPAVQAQTTSTIAGTIHDGFGALVPNAKVTLTNEDSKAIRTTKSNGEGFFTFVAVQPATYSVQIIVAGFESWKVTGIEVHPGDSLTIPKINLTIGKVVESVTVTAEVAGVTQDSGEHSTLISAGDIARLSTTGRDALELVATLPGFTVNAGTGLSNSGVDYTTTSFGSGQLGSFGANGAAPQQGFVSITTDGAQVIDVGDMGGTTANINMDQVQEVKVQTSNFGADEAKGPIIVNAVGKSGGAEYHGSLYMYARDHIFNSNDWLSKDQTPAVIKAPSKYYYPGGTIGGPVKIPGTHFNDSKRLTFWAGFEYYDQLTNVNGANSGPQYAFIPTPRMLGTDPGALGSYDFSWDALGAALNTSPAGLQTNCAQDYTVTAAYSNIGGDCHSPEGGFDQNGNTIASTGPTAGFLTAINPAMATYTSLFPAINRVPQAAGGYASDGYNWAQNVMGTKNGFQFHGRVDENISDTLKLYGTYNWEKVNEQAALNNVYYNPPDTVPFPTPEDSHGNSSYASLNLTKVINTTTTNELVAAGMYFSEPQQFQDRAKALDTGTPWETAGYEGGPLKNGDNQLPRVGSYETIGIPGFSFGNVPAGSEFLRKSSWNVSDNLTKSYRTHTLKLGVYAEQSRNNSIILGSDANSNITFARWEGCLANQAAPVVIPTGYLTPQSSSLGNTAANFLAGCPGGYTQSSVDPNEDMYFNTLEFYGTDEWKVNSKLTVTFGIRLSHLPPWVDSHGVGAAVWDPTKYGPVQPYQPNQFDEGMTLDPRTWPGITWHKEDPSVPVSGWASRPLFYSPRLGIAYDLRGDGKTVLRGGWGAYRSRDSNNIAGSAVATGMDLVDNTLYGSKNSCTLDQLMNGFTPPATGTGSQVVTCGFYNNGTVGFTNPNTNLLTAGVTPSVSADDPHDSEQPVTYNYNFTVDRQLPFGSMLEVAYVGNQSAHLATLGNTSNALYSLQNQNAIPLGAFFGPDPQVGGTSLTGETMPTVTIGGNSSLENQYRPYPNYGGIFVPHHTNWANYNALQVSLNKQRGSLAIGANYTLSKALGVRGNYDTGNTADPVNANHDYGIVSFDRPQAFNVTYSYQEGKKYRGNRELGWVLNNWELSGITKLASGPDLSILNGNTNYNLSATVGYAYGSLPALQTEGISVGAPEWLGSSDYLLQPKVTCDPRKGLQTKVLSGTQPAKQYINGTCFGLPAQGTQGAWTLPDVHGPSYFSSDLSVYKDVQMNDRQQLQLRMSAFNFLNHPISSFNPSNLSDLNLTFADQPCNQTTGVGCVYSESAAIAGLTLQNTGFGYTPYKFGVRIVEFGVKYNF